MPSDVYFIDFKATPRENLAEKLHRMLDTAKLNESLNERDLTAVKLHFGELGNQAFISPLMIKHVIEHIKKAGVTPFLTDSNTLYSGTRSDSPSHLSTAIYNGFAYPVMDSTPIIIADGLRGKSDKAVTINQKHYTEVFIGNEICEADSLVSIAHFKGHELAGFGGTLKNLGMGCASRRGKLAQHSTMSPKVVRKKCIACEDCISHCSQSAISIVDEKAKIDPDACIGCGECILICPAESIQIRWNQSVPIFLECLAEYAYGSLAGKENNSFFINFITDVSPACDCYSHNDIPIVRNIGIVASKDPVAIDQASVDLVNKEPAATGSCLKSAHAPGEDKFKALYPGVDWEIQLDHAEKIGMGSRKYTLIPIESLAWKNHGHG